ncbi:hypothetical protein QTP88_013228 [Uroleucon formosanum]
MPPSNKKKIKVKHGGFWKLEPNISITVYILSSDGRSLQRNTEKLQFSTPTPPNRQTIIYFFLGIIIFSFTFCTLLSRSSMQRQTGFTGFEFIIVFGCSRLSFVLLTQNYSLNSVNNLLENSMGARVHPKINAFKCGKVHW